VETAQQTAASTVRVWAHCTLRFYDDEGECILQSWNQEQRMPAKWLDNAYFQSAKASGWIEVIPEPQPVVVMPEPKPQPVAIEPALEEIKQELRPQSKGATK
jgi:hypothetical protein